MEPKVWYESKTQIYNGIKTLLGIIIGVGAFIAAAQHAGTLPFEVDEKWLIFIVSGATAADGAFGMWLRSQTNQPVTRSKP